MKIVCEACQAKYSIADDKVRGKVFKIRCKKCSHVIVVRGAGESSTATSGEFATSPSSIGDLALDAGWHIVVEGEQVGPLSEVDIKGRLARGEITGETYIWKEGLADWVKIATLAEFSQEISAAGGAPESANPFAAGGEPGGLFAGAPSNGAAPAADVFSSPVAHGHAGHGHGNAGRAGDLFAAPTNPVSDNAATTVSGGGGGYGGYESSLPAAVGGANAGGLTGQRHENSVLFSLSNLEALAKPSSSAPLPVSRGNAPSPSTTTEGSGLIDIRAMANMTLGGQAGNRPDSRGSDLPAFSAPQFSPVAPVLLAPSSSMPKWFIPVLAAFGVCVIALVIASAKLFSRPELPPAPVAPPVVAAPPVPAGGKPPATAPAGTAAAPPSTPPPPSEALPPREPPKAEAGDRAGRIASAHAGKGGRPGAGGGKTRGGAGAGAGANRGLEDAIDKRLGGLGASPPPRAAEAPKKPKDDIEALLEAASGGKKSSAASRREDDEPAARSAEKLPPLAMGEIVKGMNGVLPKARECYAQFKVPGVANAKVTVNPSGKVTGVTVSGKFAGTPSGNCVEGAIKTAHFAASSGLTFDYPVPLR